MNDAVIGTRAFSVVVGLLIILPFVAVRNIARLEGLSMVCLAFALFVIVILSMNWIKAMTMTSVNDTFSWGPPSAYNFFYGLAAMSWAWCVQYNTLPIYMTMHREVREEQMVTVSLGTSIGSYALFLIQGFAVYFVWGSQVETDFIDNLVEPGANYYFYYHMWVATLTAFIICIGCFASIPTLSFEARTNFHSLVVSTKRLYRSFREDDGGGAGPRDENDGIEYQAIVQPENDNDDVDNSGLLSDTLSDLGDMLEIGEEETTLSRWVEGSILIVMAAVLALFAQDLTDVISISGATYCTVRST